MDPIEFRELRKVAKKLRRSGILPESVHYQLTRSSSKQQELKVYTLELPTLSFAKDPRMAEDLVQSFLLPADTLKIREVDPASYRHEAFESVLRV